MFVTQSGLAREPANALRPPLPLGEGCGIAPRRGGLFGKTVTPRFRANGPAWSEHSGCSIAPRPAGAVGGYLLRRNLRGRTTQRAKSPAKAPAAAMAIILGVLRNRYGHSISPGCYMAFTWMLNVCYAIGAGTGTGQCPSATLSRWEKAAAGVPGGRSEKQPLHAFGPTGQRGVSIGAAASRPGQPGQWGATCCGGICGGESPRERRVRRRLRRRRWLSFWASSEIVMVIVSA